MSQATGHVVGETVPAPTWAKESQNEYMSVLRRNAGS